MQMVSVILFLVLASTNASKYFHSLPRYLQEPRERHTSDDSFYLQDNDNDDNFPIFVPKLSPDSNSKEEWTLDTDPRSVAFLQQILTNRLTKSDESRSKRTEASLSIVNALDVLRQRIILEHVRRRMNETKAQIEKNRDLLRETGKRSQRSYDEALRDFLRRYRMLRERLMSKPFPETSVNERQDTDTTRKNTDVDPGFHT